MRRGGQPPLRFSRFALSAPCSLLVCASIHAAGCAQPPSQICERFVACERAYEAAARTDVVDTSDYEAGGVCWQSADNAALCDATCASQIEAIAAEAARANLVVAACDP